MMRASFGSLLEGSEAHFLSVVSEIQAPTVLKIRRPCRFNTLRLLCLLLHWPAKLTSQAHAGRRTGGLRTGRPIMPSKSSASTPAGRRHSHPLFSCRSGKSCVAATSAAVARASAQPTRATSMGPPSAVGPAAAGSPAAAAHSTGALCIAHQQESIFEAPRW